MTRRRFLQAFGIAGSLTLVARPSNAANRSRAVLLYDRDTSTVAARLRREPSALAVCRGRPPMSGCPSISPAALHALPVDRVVGLLRRPGALRIDAVPNGETTAALPELWRRVGDLLAHPAGSHIVLLDEAALDLSADLVERQARLDEGYAILRERLPTPLSVAVVDASGARRMTSASPRAYKPPSF